MNIKNPEAHALAKELAALTGESVTAAVTEALRERLERVRKERERPKAERILEIASEMAAIFREIGYAPPDHGELLYDERGLPK
jgi:antitoxin VapB